LVSSVGFAADAKIDITDLMRDIKGGRVNPNIERNDNMITPLMLAAINSDHDSVQTLLSIGANPNHQEAKGLTALMIAANQEDGLEVIQDLLNYGVDPSLANTYGQTALMLASSRGYADIVGVLLARGARYDQVSTIGKIALFYAAKEGHTAVVKKLLEPMRDDQETMKYVSDAINVAKQFNHTECVDILGQHKKNSNN
jgi:hypothetical protein